MCTDVLLQCAKPGEHLVAFATLVWLVFAMYRKMHFEVRGASEATTAFLALERFLPYNIRKQHYPCSMYIVIGPRPKGLRPIVSAQLFSYGVDPALQLWFSFH